MEAISFVSGDFLPSFPYGTKVLSATKIGTSTWTTTARIKVGHPNGAHVQCFLKCAAEDRGRVMMEGEYNAMSELYKTMPNFVPKLISWGSVVKLDTYYFLPDFIDMSDYLPEPSQLCLKLVQMHRNSISPTSKFRLHVTTCQVQTQQAVSWESSWTELSKPPILFNFV